MTALLALVFVLFAWVLRLMEAVVNQSRIRED